MCVDCGVCEPHLAHGLVCGVREGKTCGWGQHRKGIPVYGCVLNVGSVSRIWLMALCVESVRARPVGLV